MSSVGFRLEAGLFAESVGRKPQGRRPWVWGGGGDQDINGPR